MFKKDEKEITSSITGGATMSKSTRNRGEIFGSEPPNTAVGKYFKILFQNFRILIKFESFCTLNFPRYYIKKEIRR